ncbi:MAG: Hint domain-containing protein [Acidiphilium sp.]
MASLQIIAPATIGLIDGLDVSSLGRVPPGGIAISDSNTTAISVTIASGLALSASSAGGASVSAGGGAVTISGDLASVNAALASLLATASAVGVGTLSILASDGTAMAATTRAVRVLPDSPPGFVAPPASLALQADSLSSLGLMLADDPAKALAGFGLSPEQLTVTLIASAGVLLLDPSAFAGIGIAGDATGAITLSASSAELAALNMALGAVEIETSAGGTLEYIARQSGGPLPDAVTSGELTYAVSGAAVANAESWTGGTGDWQNSASWSGGTVPGLHSTLAVGDGATLSGYGVGGTLALAGAVDLEGWIGLAAATLADGAALRIGAGGLDVGGGLDIGGGTLLVGAAGTLAAAGVTLGGGGALIGFGAVTLDGLDATGAALLPGGAVLDGPVAVNAGGLVDFTGLLQADSQAATIGLVAISLATGGTVAGAGTLVAGNFSESEDIAGPGTILALGPAPLTIAAGSVGGGVDFAIAPGAALELGAVAPLYGVFNATPITVGADATISFAPGAGAGQDGGAYASTLGEQGGVLVLDNPESFAATLVGFAPGDRIVLPTLENLSVLDVTAAGFEVEGVVVGHTTQSEIVTIHADLAGLIPAVETDAAGMQVIGLRAGSPALTLDDTVASSAEIDAVGGVATPLRGLGLLVPNDGGGLVLTVAAARGMLALGTGGAAATLVLSAATALGLNAELGEIVYTAPASGSGDVLDFTGGTGLAGLTAAIGVAVATAGTLDFAGSGGGFDAATSWRGGIVPAAGDVAAFASHAGGPGMVTGPGVAGMASIAGAWDFAGAFDFVGSAGTGIAIGGGGVAVFDGDTTATIGAGAVVGDASGAGTLGVAGAMTVAGIITAGGVAAAAGSLIEIAGTLAAAGLVLGGGGAATLEATGSLALAATTLGVGGVLRADGGARAGLGAFDDVGGVLSLAGTALADAGSATLGSGMIVLADAATFDATGFGLAGGTLVVAGEAMAAFGAATLTQAAGAVLDLAGTLLAGGYDAAGIAAITGEVSLGGAASFASAAAIGLLGGTLEAANISIAGGATLQGHGEIGLGSGVGLASLEVAAAGLLGLSPAGTLVAAGGALILGADLAGGATIDAGAALELVGAATGGSIAFAGTAALLTIDDIAGMTDAVANMVAGDAIDLVGIAPSLVSTASGSIGVAGEGGFALAESGTLALASDGAGGTEITIGGAVPCFTRGTRLLTPAGYRRVESLRPGDELVTLEGEVLRIRWIGWRVIDLACDAAALHPVVIAPGAFGPGRPERRLAVSPLHAIFADGVLVPAVLLVNGATIVRDEAAFAVTYYHVELDRHAVIVAENLPAETYRDNGNRDRFAAGLGEPGAPMPACAPLAIGGDSLRAVRASLHRRALALGYKIVHGSLVEALVEMPEGKCIVRPRRHAGRLIFDLPQPAARLVLRTRAGRAADADAASEDRRLLGLCVGALRADGRLVTVRHGAGWHERAPGDRGRWSMAAAELALPRPAWRISIDLLGSIPRWVRDPADIRG